MVSGGYICAPQRDTDMAPPHKALWIWVKRFSEYLAFVKSHRPDSWRGFLYIHLISQILVFKNIIFRVMSFNAFWKALRLGNLVWNFLWLIFGSGICFKKIRKRSLHQKLTTKKQKFGFVYCPHSIIPVRLEIRSTHWGFYCTLFRQWKVLIGIRAHLWSTIQEYNAKCHHNGKNTVCNTAFYAESFLQLL